jgi:hypothetical protein
MGNRGQIEVVHLHADLQAGIQANSVWLYSHWEGCFVAEFARVALLSLPPDGWSDPERVTRRFVDDIPRHRVGNPFNLDKEHSPIWVQHRDVVLDVPKQMVRFVVRDDLKNVSGTFAFQVYVRLSPPTLDRAFHRDFGGVLSAHGRTELERRLADLQQAWPPNRRGTPARGTLADAVPRRSAALDASSVAVLPVEATAAAPPAQSRVRARRRGHR